MPTCSVDDEFSGFEAAAGSFGAELDAVDLGRCDADGLDRFVALCRGVQSRVEAATVRAGIRADELARKGCGAPARDLFARSGAVRGTTARREAARAAVAARSPVLASAMGSGGLGADRLDVVVRRLGPLDDDHLGRLDLKGLLERGVWLPVDAFDRLMRRAVDATAELEPQPDPESDSNDGPIDPNGPAKAASKVTSWFDHGQGMGHIHATLDPERFEAVMNALGQHTNLLAAELGLAKDANLVAQALVDLICSSGQRRDHLPEVIVVVDEATMRTGRHDEAVAETADGHGLSDQAIARLCCDAVLRRVVLDDQQVPINVGRRHRTATNAQWTALRTIYTSCAWDGCDRPLTHCQAHHIHEWDNGGATDLSNLVPMCSAHHHLVHEGRWHIELLADRAMRITRPDGHHHATTPPPTRRPPPDQPVGKDPPPVMDAAA